MRRSALLLLVVPLLLSAAASAQDVPPSPSSDALRDSTDAILTRTGAPGAGVVLVYLTTGIIGHRFWT